MLRITSSVIRQVTDETYRGNWLSGGYDDPLCLAGNVPSEEPFIK